MSHSKIYSQKYRKEWKLIPEFKGWLKPYVSNDTRAYCLYCKTEFSAKLSDIKKHASTQKHTDKSKPYNQASQSTLPFFSKNIDSLKQAEATMAMAIAEHCSILSLVTTLEKHVKLLFQIPVQPKIFGCTVPSVPK